LPTNFDFGRWNATDSHSSRRPPTLSSIPTTRIASYKRLLKRTVRAAGLAAAHVQCRHATVVPRRGTHDHCVRERSRGRARILEKCKENEIIVMCVLCNEMHSCCHSEQGVEDCVLEHWLYHKRILFSAFATNILSITANAKKTNCANDKCAVGFQVRQ
jgi:hypothetical protein